MLDFSTLQYRFGFKSAQLLLVFIVWLKPARICQRKRRMAGDAPPSNSKLSSLQIGDKFIKTNEDIKLFHCFVCCAPTVVGNQSSLKSKYNTALLADYVRENYFCSFVVCSTLVVTSTIGFQLVT